MLDMMQLPVAKKKYIHQLIGEWLLGVIRWSLSQWGCCTETSLWLPWLQAWNHAFPLHGRYQLKCKCSLTNHWVVVKLGKSVAQTRNADCLQNKSGFSQFTMLFLKLNFCFRFKVKWSLFVGLITVSLLFGEQLVSDCRQVAVFHANCGESK